MESYMKKDGSTKTLFDYSPQNQNYIIVNDLLEWEQKNNDVPLLNEKTAIKVYNMISRKFGSWKYCNLNRFSYSQKRNFIKAKPLKRVRKCWIGKDYYNNYERLIHDISHNLQRYRTGDDNHSSSQSILEKEITFWIIENDWFKDKVIQKPKIKLVKIKPTKIEINETKISKLDKTIENQEKKIKSIMESMWKNKTTRNRLKNLVVKQKQEK
jgi:hypothetical protein|tara:strand:- start:1452 stop:2087 length:636 start_codon:yes stop_codon:yes gene_type:complete